MKTCYLCGKRTDDCLLEPPACKPCREREGLKAARIEPSDGHWWTLGEDRVEKTKLAVGTPGGWKTTQTWTLGWDGPWPTSSDSEENFVQDAKQAGWVGPRRRVTFPVGEDGKPTGPGREEADEEWRFWCLCGHDAGSRDELREHLAGCGQPLPPPLPRP